jgi:acyl-CoA thioesterase-1
MTIRCHIRSVAAALVLVAALAAGCSTAKPDPVPPPAPPEIGGPAAPEPVRPGPKLPRQKVVAFGDSLTAGFGLEKSLSYPAQLQRMLDERGYNYEVVNAGVSGETSAGGLRRIDRFLDPDVAVVVVALGGNDGLRGLPVKDLKKNLEAMVQKAKARGITVVLAGMEAPPYLGEDYTRQFRSAYAEIGKERGVAVLPFLLAGVAGVADLNQVDGIHPNEEGAKKVARNVLNGIEPVLVK